MQRFRVTTAVWIVLLYVSAATITVAAFYSFIIPEYRNTAFYSAVIGCVVAELFFSAYLLYLLVTGGAVRDTGHAVRIRVMTLVSVWTLAIIASGAVAVAPTVTNTFFSDKLFLFQLMFTFLVLAAGYFLHRQDAVIADGRTGAERRGQFQSFSAGVTLLLEAVRATADKWPDRAVEFDRLTKRLDTLKTQLLSIPPMGERENDRLVQPVSADEIKTRLRELHQHIRTLAGASREALPAQVDKVCQAVDAVVSLLRHREDTLAF